MPMCLGTSCLASPVEFDAHALVARLKRELPARTAYVEVRFSQMFERPMIARGALEYLGPGKLGKRVDEPYQENTTIADGQVTVERGKRKPRTISLERVPELDGFLRGFSALLGGDAAVLKQDFELTGSAEPGHWHLRLTPKDARLQRRIKAITVDGEDGVARCFSIIDADGDTSIMMVEEQARLALPEPLKQAAVVQSCQRGSAAP